MHSGSLARTYDAGGALPPRRIVKFTGDDVVNLATAATDDAIGVTADVAVASGERVDVYRSGPVEIEVGGNIARGKDITADASGKAVQAAPGAGTSCRVVGGGGSRAYVAGDIGLFWLRPGALTTPAA